MGAMKGEMYCPVCGARRMYRTSIVLTPYAIVTGWHCLRCEQQKTAQELEVADG